MILLRTDGGQVGCIFCLHKWQSLLLRRGLLSRGDGGYSFHRVEPFDWKLVFASNGTVWRGTGELRRWEAPSGSLSGNLPACVCEDGATQPREEAEGLPPPTQQLSGACAHGCQTRVVPAGPGGLGLRLSPGPLSRWLLPASLRGTVNPLNGLGGNSSSPPLNGSSDAACGALEVAELRPYSGPNHPPTPSQNNNNPSDILAAGGTQAAFVLSRSGDPLLVQQQCPFVRPACWTGTVNGRFC